MGFAAQGVTALSLLNEATKFAGIRFEDVTPVYLSFPQQIAALQNKALDGTLLIEPQATVAVNAGIGVRFMDTNMFYPRQQISVIFYSDKFATERKDTAEKFMRGWLRGVRAYNDAVKDGKIAGKGADEVVETISKNFNLEPKLVREMYSQAVDPTGAVLIGVAAGIVPFFACTKLKSWFHYDDALDTFGVHAVGGTLGAFLTGVLATADVNANLNTNLKDIVGKTLWLEQLKAMGLTLMLSVAATTVIAYALKATLGLRPSLEGEETRPAASPLVKLR